jgi:hypothetical protein
MSQQYLRKPVSATYSLIVQPDSDLHKTVSKINFNLDLFSPLRRDKYQFILVTFCNKCQSIPLTFSHKYKSIPLIFSKNYQFIHLTFSNKYQSIHL